MTSSQKKLTNRIENLSELKPCISGDNVSREAQNEYCDNYCQEAFQRSGYCIASQTIGEWCWCD